MLSLEILIRDWFGIVVCHDVYLAVVVRWWKTRCSLLSAPLLSGVTSSSHPSSSASASSSPLPPTASPSCSSWTWVAPPTGTAAPPTGTMATPRTERLHPLASGSILGQRGTAHWQSGSTHAKSGPSLQYFSFMNNFSYFLIRILVNVY